MYTFLSDFRNVNTIRHKFLTPGKDSRTFFTHIRSIQFVFYRENRLIYIRLK